MLHCEGREKLEVKKSKPRRGRREKGKVEEGGFFWEGKPVLGRGGEKDEKQVSVEWRKLSGFPKRQKGQS